MRDLSTSWVFFLAKHLMKRPEPSPSSHTGSVPDDLHGRALDAIVRALLDVSWAKARRLVTTGKVQVAGETVTDGRRKVRAGTPIEIVPAAPGPKAKVRSRIERDLIVHVDPHVVVVNKPPHISTVPYGDDEEEVTLDQVVREILAKRSHFRGRAPLGVVHRLDKLTSGLLVFARTVAAKKQLSQQFRQHTIEREYWALVYGSVRKRTFSTYLTKDRGDRLRGSAPDAKKGGQLAVTHVEPVETFSDGATLVACRLETGRTHQIRIHLSEAGHPVLGDPVYGRDFDGPPLFAPRLMLHARRLGFEHPARSGGVEFEVAPPDDFQQALERLRAGA